jgi:hypothetical protein
MNVRLASALMSALLVCGCGDSPTAATPQRLTAVITPSPLTAPDAPGEILYDLRLSASGSGSVLLLRSDTLLLTESGAKVGETRRIWGPSAGCNVCTTDVRIQPGRAELWSGQRVTFVGGPKPTRFVYTIEYQDDIGPASTSVEVPIR